MSGTAAAGTGEATIGLVPRYLRGRERDSGQGWGPDGETPDQSARTAFEADPGYAARDSGATSVTEEMRRRIAECAKPEKHRARPLLIGLAAVAVIVAAGVLFPDSVLALLPSVDPSH
jgi:hypothetical protein